jgi:excisionase family DNA binding protein
MTENDYMTVAEAAKQISIGKVTMYKIVRQKGFPCVKIGKRYVIHRERFAEWMKEHEGREIMIE